MWFCQLLYKKGRVNLFWNMTRVTCISGDGCFLVGNSGHQISILWFPFLSVWSWTFILLGHSPTVGKVNTQSNSQKIYWSCPNIKIYYKVCELLNNQQKEKHIWNVGLYQGTFLSFLYHSGWKNTRFATRLHSSTESKQKTVIIALNYIPSVMSEEPFWSGHSVFASVLTHFIKIMNFYSLIIGQN